MTTATITASDEAATPPARRRLRPQRRHWAVAGLLAATALLYCWNLSRNGWGNDFYAAAAQAGGVSWKAWLFGSLDFGNIGTVDKPPAALWVTGLFVRIFGLSSWSVLLPQALEGVATVGVLYATVRRVLIGSIGGRTATTGALLAGASLALIPAAALIFRFNNPDALLVLLMTLAAYATVRACQAASWRWLALCGVALGFAFLAKMLQGLLVLPGFGLTYLLFARTTWLRRVRDLAFGTVALIVASGWYVVLTILWPASSRPYIGGSTGNSFMDLVLGYNGFARILGNSGGGGGGGFRGPGGNGAPGTSFGGSTGLERLLSNEFGNEISWLLPMALVVVVGMVVFALRRRLSRDVLMGSAVFGTWLIVTALVFSYMSGTIHPYYTVALAPAIAALVGMGAAVGWSQRENWYGTSLLVAMVAAGAGWGVVRLWRAGWGWPGLGVAVGALGVIGVVALLISRTWGGARLAAAAATAVVGGGLAVSVFGIATVNTTHSGSIPSVVQTAGGSGMGFGMPGGGFGNAAGGAPGGRGTGSGAHDRTDASGAHDRKDASGTPRERRSGGQRFGGGFGAFGGGRTNAALIDLLKNTKTEWAAATQGAQSQAGYQLNSGRSVIAIGGFMNDPAPTLDQFKKLVSEGRVGYYISGGMGGGPGRTSDIQKWVEQNFTATDVGGTTVYKLT